MCKLCISANIYRGISGFIEVGIFTFEKMPSEGLELVILTNDVQVLILCLILLLLY